MTVAASISLARTESAILLLFTLLVGLLGASVTTVVIVGAELEPVDGDDESIELEPVTPTPDATPRGEGRSGGTGDAPSFSPTPATPTSTPDGGTPTASAAESPASGAAGDSEGGGTGGNGGAGGGGGTGGGKSPDTAESPTPTPARTASPTATATPTPTSTPDESDGGAQISGNAARLSVSNAAPGDTASDDVTVTNTGDRSGRLRIANVTASGDENGLTDAELAAGDGATSGELADVLGLRVVVVAPNGTEIGAYGTGDGARPLTTLAAAGPSDDLLGLDPGESVTLSLAWRIPTNAGNEIQSDTVEFATEVQLRATS